MKEGYLKIIKYMNIEEGSIHNSELDTKKAAARVFGTLQSIKKNSDSFKSFERPTQEKLGGKLGEGILKDLPSEVSSFTHSAEFPEIRAEREIGTEHWDKENASIWVKDVIGKEV